MSVGCLSITKPDGGAVIPDKDFYDFGESITVVCRQDYNLIGDETLICLRPGLWSKETPTCSQSQGKIFVKRLCYFVTLPHKVKTQYVYYRLIASYLLFPWRNPAEMSRRSILFHV